MQAVQALEGHQSATNRKNIEDDPLFERHNVEERIWEFPIDRRGVFDPC